MRDALPRRPSSVRFPAMLRVDFEVEQRRTFVFTSRVNARALWLRSPKPLPDGLRLRVDLSLAKDEVLTLEGTLRSTPEDAAEGQVCLELESDQHEGLFQLRRYIDEALVPKLEEFVARSPRSAERVRELAGYYTECGRSDDALTLWRRSWLASLGQPALAEGFAEALLAEVKRAGSSEHPAFQELWGLLASVEASRRSAVLVQIEEEARALVEAWALEQRKAQSQQSEVARREAEMSFAQLRARASAEAEASVRAVYELKLADRESELTALLQAARQAEEAARTEAKTFQVQAEELRGARAADRTSMERLQARLAQHDATLAEAHARHAQVHQELEQRLQTSTSVEAELRAQLARAQDATAVLGTQLNRNLAELDIVRQRCAELEVQQSQSKPSDDAPRHRLEVRLQELEASETESRAFAARLQVEAELLRATLSDERDTLEQQRQRILELEGARPSEFDALRAELAKAREALHQASEDLAQSRSEFERFRGDAAQEQAVLQAQLAEANQRADAQRSAEIELRLAQQSKTQAQESAQRTQAELAALQETLAAERRRSTELAGRSEAERRTVHALTERAQLAESLLAQERDARDALHQALTQLESFRKATEAAARDAQAAEADARAEAAHARADLDQARGDAEYARADAEQTRALLTEAHEERLRLEEAFVALETSARQRVDELERMLQEEHAPLATEPQPEPPPQRPTAVPVPAANSPSLWVSSEPQDDIAGALSSIQFDEASGDG